MTKLSDLTLAQQEILRDVYARLARAEATLDALIADPVTGSLAQHSAASTDCWMARIRLRVAFEGVEA